MTMSSFYDLHSLILSFGSKRSPFSRSSSRSSHESIWEMMPNTTNISLSSSCKKTLLLRILSSRQDAITTAPTVSCHSQEDEKSLVRVRISSMRSEKQYSMVPEKSLSSDKMSIATERSRERNSGMLSRSPGRVERSRLHFESCSTRSMRSMDSIGSDLRARILMI